MANPLDPYPGIPLKHPNSGREFSDGERKILYDRQQQRLAEGGGRHRDPLAPPVEPEPARGDDTVTFAPVDDEDGGLDERWNREERRRTAAAGPTESRLADRAVRSFERAAGSRRAPRERRPRALGAARWRPPIWLALVGVVVGFVFGALLATMGIMADPTILPGGSTPVPTVTQTMVPEPAPTVTFVPPVEMPAP